VTPYVPPRKVHHSEVVITNIDPWTNAEDCIKP